MSEPQSPHGIFKTMLVAFGDQCQACQADDPLIMAKSFIQENFGVIERILAAPSPVGTPPLREAMERIHSIAVQANTRQVSLDPGFILKIIESLPRSAPEREGM